MVDIRASCPYVRPIIALCGAVFFACNRSPDPPHRPAAESDERAAVTQTTAPGASAGAIRGDVRKAEIGKPAPDFVLRDLEGATVHLSDYKGEIVVLEWFNPGCPFVNLAHTKGSLKGLAARSVKTGVVWLAVNSGGPGKQGHGVAANREGKERFQLGHPILMDESGEVGRAYDAKRTPHLFVIDATGTLVYAGAIENSPDGEGESPTGGQLVNYVDQAIEDVRANRPVRVPRTDAYGCTVKYGDA